MTVKVKSTWIEEHNGIKIQREKIDLFDCMKTVEQYKRMQPHLDKVEVVEVIDNGDN